LTQRVLAGDAVTASYVSLVEAGRRVPTLDVVVHLARVLDVPVSGLLAGGDVGELDRDERLDVSSLLTEVAARDSMDFNEHDRAITALRVALERARARGQPMRVVELGLQLQQAYAATGAHREQVALLEELLALPPSQDSPELEVLLRGDLAAALRCVGRTVEARQVVDTALGQVVGTDLEGTAWHVKLLGVAVAVLMASHALDRLEGVVGQLLDMAARVEGRSVQGRAHWAASRAYAALGDGVAAQRHLAEAQRMLDTPATPLRDWIRFCRASGSVLLDIGGDLDEVRSWLDRAERAARALDIPAEYGRVGVFRACYELACGRPGECLAILDPLLDDASALLASEVEALEWRLLHARAMARLHQRQPAERTLRHVAAQAEALGRLDLAVQAWHELDDLNTDPTGSTG
jgi:transcriptional regulator with XRE-family HTH domain